MNRGDSGEGADSTVDSGQADGSTSTKCLVDKDCDAAGLTVDAKKCERAACNQTSGKCQIAVAGDGAKCDDGAACTADDVCSAGKCEGTIKCEYKDPVSGLPNVCKIGKCADDGTGKCEFYNTTTGLCDDGDPCTSSDKCQVGGKCNGELKVCPDVDLNPCTLETCNAAKQGACELSLQPSGTACNDNNACTKNDQCEGGKCGGGPVTCGSVPNPCAEQACDTVLGCVAKPLNSGASCVSGDSCYIDEKCNNAVCSGKLIIGVDDGNPCTKDGGEGKGLAKCKISHEPLDGTSCDDGEPCSIGDSCVKGACKAQPLVCNDGNPCTQDACDPNKCVDNNGIKVCGQCSYLPVKDGAVCEDGDKCTSKDSCKVGKCTGIDLLSSGGCDDKNACTNDNCQPGAGCINVPIDPQKTVFCDDGDPCTEVDKCASATCKGVPRDCKDTDPCTNDKCDPQAVDLKKACLHESYEGPCNDNDKCSSNDLCTGGTCTGKPVLCDDKNTCTIDICDSQKGCIYKFSAGGSPCDDGLSCTVNDYCDAGKCIAAKDDCKPCDSNSYCKQFDDNDVCNGIVKCIDTGAGKGKVCAIDNVSVVKCDASGDTPCSTNTCNSDTGVCSAAMKQEGLPCTATSKCITAAVCNLQGQCNGKTLNCDDKNDCTVDSCDPKLGCKFAGKADGTVCDDGTLCTPAEGDKCSKGQCLNPVNTCACATDQDCLIYESKDGDGCNEKFKCLSGAGGSKFCKPVAGTETVCDTSKDTPCVISTCEKASGQCKPVTKADTTACDDSDKCTLGEACATGKCVSIKKLNCNDNNACTDDICSGEFGCASGPKASGAKCTDSDACTTNDVCKDGKCTGGKLDCNDGSDCTLDLCSKVTGCTNQIDDTLPCDDNDGCTGKDVCKNGTCAGPPLKCDDGNPCTIDACDGQGGCKNIVIDGKDCNDGDACTIGDVCKTAKCEGIAKKCDDGNGCTDDTCKSGTCVILAQSGTPCDDGNACTGNDACDNKGACTGKVFQCDTTNACIAYPQGCLPTKGCFSVPNDGKTCTDNDLCSFNDTCKGGACTGLSVDCNDGDVCTNDACDPKKGCQIKQNTCDDGNSCTTDTCNKQKGCQHAVLDGAKCEDGDLCTDQTQCQTGKCVGKQVICDDKSGCTLDGCEKDKGCVFLAGEDTQVTCDDKDPCTTDSCSKGSCVGSKKECDDANPCTVDSCNSLKGCITVDVAEKSSCDDGDACTKDTMCLGGNCQGGSLTCGSCAVDKDCDIFDNNNKCDGQFTCKAGATGKKACYFDATKIVCDTTGDTFCNKSVCLPQAGTCTMQEAVNGSKCQDGLGCTVSDTCLNGQCKSGPQADCSKSADACNSANCKETGKITEFACVSLPKDGSPICDADGSGCTANDFCSAGKCFSGAAVDCSGVAKECQTASCKSTGAASFQCATAAVADGGLCNDEQLCTEGDFCKTGKCQAGTQPHNCSNLNSICAIGSCDKVGNGGLGACIPKPQNDGKVCDADNNGCSQDDKCAAGTCISGAPANCQSAATNCATGACKSTGAATFDCVGAPKKDELPCEADSNGCTVGDACKAGKCATGKAMDCAAKNSADGCQEGVCKSTGPSSSFCDVGYATKGKFCNSDNNGCTQSDQCNGLGACQPGKAVDCLSVTTGCSQGICKTTGTETYTCQGDPKADGSACDADISGCTKDDKCASGKCVAGAKIDCTDPKAPKSQCLSALCVASGSTTYQCDNAPTKDNTPCNADSNGCTVNDSCQLGFCDAGDIQTCSTLAGLCADATCKSLSDNSYKCDAVPKESYPALDPQQACTVTDSPPKCPTGYTCTVTDELAKLATCLSSKTVYCDDGDKCTEADACAGGKCTGGTNKNCDDQDTCTLDSCSAGKCANKTIVGCTKCLDETFDNPFPTTWTASSKVKSFVNWAHSVVKPFAGTGNFRASWKGPVVIADGSDRDEARLRHRRLYIADTAAASLEFHLAMVVAQQGCGGDDFQVRINGIKVWEKCESVQPKDSVPGTNYQKFTLDLSKFAGAPADLEFRVIAGANADNFGTIDLDNVKLTGACGPGCVGVPFEPLTEDPDAPPADLVAESIPQPWRIESSDPAFITLAAAAANGHTGIGFLRAEYKGAPSSGKQETTKITIPRLFAMQGDKLWFAMRAPTVGDAGCGNDDLVVKIGGKEVYRRCNAQATWLTVGVDLPAGVTSDVEFSVVSGFGPSTAGNFEIDDIGVAGKCQYACFFSDFDTGTISLHWTATAGEPSKWKPWVITAEQSKSPKGSAYNVYPNPGAPTTETQNFILAKTSFFIPVLGFTFSYNLNLFVETPNPNCLDSGAPLPAGPAVFGAGLLLRCVFFGIGNQPTFNNANAMNNNADGNYSLDSHCSSTVGWQPVLGEMTNTAFAGLDCNLMITAVATASNKTLKSYVDDVLMMCR
ncbi:MAG: hypothetical protein EXR77_01490 [Myxococcales bacterium]|nr:hypothetical protein [Myxococcales bacterium]